MILSFCSIMLPEMLASPLTRTSAMILSFCSIMLPEMLASPQHQPIAHTHTVSHTHSTPNAHSFHIQCVMHTYTHTRTFDACDHTHIRRIRAHSTHAITHTSDASDASDPFVIVTPRFYSIVASSPDRTHTHATYTVDSLSMVFSNNVSRCQRRAQCGDSEAVGRRSGTKSDISGTNRCDPFVIITPRFYNIIASSPDTHTHTTYTTACDPFVIITPRKHHRIISHPDSSPDRTHDTHTYTRTYDVCDPFVIITPRFYNSIVSSLDRTLAHTHAHTTHAIRL